MQGAFSSNKILTSSERLKNKAIFFGGILCCLQALDGVLTTIGVKKYGADIEANPMIRELIINLGTIPAISLIKILAIVVICCLVGLSRRILWINNAIGALSCIYLFGAVIPWIYLLFFFE